MKLNSSLAAVATVVLATLATSCTSSSSSEPTKTPAIRIEEILKGHWQKLGTNLPGGLTIAITTPRGDYFASTLGTATPGSHFRAASTTKSFTAAAILLLDQRGLLDIDHTLTTTMPGKTEAYLPATPDYAIPHKEQITIKQLLRHRGGVFDVGNTNVPATAPSPYAGKRYVDWIEETQGEKHTFTIDELVGVVAKNKLEDSLPDQSFHYSNTGYSLLAKIIERVSGKTYAQFVRDELLVPNGLDQTTFPDDGNIQDLPQPFLEGTTRVGGTFYPTTSRNVSWGVGEGNVVTTPGNLLKWMRRLLKGEAGVNLAQLDRMRECIPTNEIHVSYGLGLECDPLDLGKGHNGAITGYLTTARHQPDGDITVVIFATMLDADGLPTEGAMLYEAARQSIALVR